MKICIVHDVEIHISNILRTIVLLRIFIVLLAIMNMN